MNLGILISGSVVVASYVALLYIIGREFHEWGVSLNERWRRHEESKAEREARDKEFWASINECKKEIAQ